MRNLVRGGIILVIFSLCVVLILAQTRPARVLSIANDSQEAETLNKSVNSNTNTNSSKSDSTANKTDKLVKTTGMVSAARAASRGSFIATAYCLTGRTALGGGVRRGIIAADPSILKLGSQVLLGAGSYTGQYTVADTGGGVRGRHIDIWVPSCSEARRFGRRTVLISSIEK